MLMKMMRVSPEQLPFCVRLWSVVVAVVPVWDVMRWWWWWGRRTRRSAGRAGRKTGCFRIRGRSGWHPHPI